MQGNTKKNVKKSNSNKYSFPINTKWHQPCLFCYFIESGRSLSLFLKTKTLVALNTGRSLWGLFPLKSLLITLQCMWVITQGTLLTRFATVTNSNFKSSRSPSAAFLLDSSLCLPPQYVSCLYINASSWGKNGFVLFLINAGSEMALPSRETPFHSRSPASSNSSTSSLLDKFLVCAETVLIRQRGRVKDNHKLKWTLHAGVRERMVLLSYF